MRGGERFNPRESLAKLADGSTSSGEWTATCRSMKIDGVLLTT